MYNLVTANDAKGCLSIIRTIPMRQSSPRAAHYSRAIGCTNDVAGYPNGPALVGRIERTIPNTVERPFRSLAEIAEDLRPVEWLWPNWLPLGMITLLAARPGTGKSLVALDVAHRIITGQAWPDGTGMPDVVMRGARDGATACDGVTDDGTATVAGGTGGPRPVIYIDGENIAEVHNARAVAWGLPREHLYMLLADEEDVLLDLSGTKYQELLTQMVYRLKPALVIVDSLGAVMGKGGERGRGCAGAAGLPGRPGAASRRGRAAHPSPAEVDRRCSNRQQRLARAVRHGRPGPDSGIRSHHGHVARGVGSHYGSDWGQA